MTNEIEMMCPRCLEGYVEVRYQVASENGHVWMDTQVISDCPSCYFTGDGVDLAEYVEEELKWQYADRSPDYEEERT